MNNNNNGYQQFLTTLTVVSNKVIKQKFYEIKNLPDYVNFEVGVGGVSNELLKWATGEVADDGETGIIGANADYERNASVDVVIGSKKYPRVQWTKKITYNWFDIQQATESGLIDLIEAKETARKRNFDLMIQKIIFLGSEVNSNITGLLNNANATINTTVITQSLSSMTTLNGIAGAMLNAYLSNNNNTVKANTLVIPQSDYITLASSQNTQYDTRSKLTVLEEYFKGATGKADFKILPCVYCDANFNPMNKNIYVLYNRDIDSMAFDMALDYTQLGTNTYDNYNFTNNAVGMFGGVNLYRPQELMYFEY